MIHNIFPLSVYRGKAGFAPALRKKMAAFIVEQRHAKDSEAKSDGFTWTGDVMGMSGLHLDKNFKPLMKSFHTHVQIYLKELGHRTNDVDIFVTRCWGTVATSGERIAFHNHRNSALSIVYYPSLPEGSAKLAFQDEAHQNEPGPGMINQVRKNSGNFDIRNPLSAPQIFFPVEEDDIVVFPSSAMHGVLSGRQNEPRISIAADTTIVTNSMVGDETLLPPVSVWRRLNS